MWVMLGGIEGPEAPPRLQLAGDGVAARGLVGFDRRVQGLIEADRHPYPNQMRATMVENELKRIQTGV